MWLFESEKSWQKIYNHFFFIFCWYFGNPLFSAINFGCPENVKKLTLSTYQLMHQNHQISSYSVGFEPVLPSKVRRCSDFCWPQKRWSRYDDRSRTMPHRLRKNSSPSWKDRKWLCSHLSAKTESTIWPCVDKHLGSLESWYMTPTQTMHLFLVGILTDKVPLHHFSIKTSILILQKMGGIKNDPCYIGPFIFSKMCHAFFSKIMHPTQPTYLGFPWHSPPKIVSFAIFGGLSIASPLPIKKPAKIERS